MGYVLHYAENSRALVRCDTYPEALEQARGRAAASNRMIVISNDYDGVPFAIVLPDGSVSSA